MTKKKSRSLSADGAFEEMMMMTLLPDNAAVPAAPCSTTTTAPPTPATSTSSSSSSCTMAKIKRTKSVNGIDAMKKNYTKSSSSPRGTTTTSPTCVNGFDAAAMMRNDTVSPSSTRMTITKSPIKMMKRTTSVNGIDVMSSRNRNNRSSMTSTCSSSASSFMMTTSPAACTSATTSSTSSSLVMQMEAEVRQLSFVVGRAQDDHQQQDMALTRQVAALQELDQQVHALRDQHNQIVQDWRIARDEFKETRQLKKEMMEQQDALQEEITKLQQDCKQLEFQRIQMELDVVGKRQFHTELELVLERLQQQRQEEDCQIQEKRRNLHDMFDQEAKLRKQLERLRAEKRQP